MSFINVTNFYKNEESFNILDIEYEILSINGEELLFFILEKYDGVKQEVNLEQNILLLWYDYKDLYEEWFYIKSPKEVLENYLSNQIGILDLMEKSSIEIIKRNYENYDSLFINNNLLNINDKNIEFPDNIKLGYNILSQMQFIGLYNNTYLGSKNILYEYQQDELITDSNNDKNKNNIMLAA